MNLLGITLPQVEPTMERLYHYDRMFEVVIFDASGGELHRNGILRIQDLVFIFDYARVRSGLHHDEMSMMIQGKYFIEASCYETSQPKGGES